MRKQQFKAQRSDFGGGKGCVTIVGYCWFISIQRLSFVKSSVPVCYCVFVLLGFFPPFLPCSCFFWTIFSCLRVCKSLCVSLHYYLFKLLLTPRLPATWVQAYNHTELTNCRSCRVTETSLYRRCCISGIVQVAPGHSTGCPSFSAGCPSPSAFFVLAFVTLVDL